MARLATTRQAGKTARRIASLNGMAQAGFRRKLRFVPCYVAFAALTGLLALLAFPVRAMAERLPKTPYFHNFDLSSGLPSRSVIGIQQDAAGYIWVATGVGLARYDGVGFSIWQQERDNPDSLPANVLEALHIDHRDRIWVGAFKSGLSMMGADRKGFRHFPQLSDYCIGEVWAITSTTDGNVWVGTSDGGVCRVDPEERFHGYQASEDDPDTLPGNMVLAMAVDQRGRLWVGTDNGLARWNSEKDIFERVGYDVLQGRMVDRIQSGVNDDLWIYASEAFHIDASDTLAPSPWGREQNPNRSGVVFQDSGGTDWILSTDGLYLIDGDQAPELIKFAGDGSMMNHIDIFTTLEDREGGLWFGTLSRGVFYLPPNWDQFTMYRQIQGKSFDEMELRTTGFAGDDFLIVTSEGIAIVDPTRGSINTFIARDNLIRAGITGIGPAWRRSDGKYWIGAQGMISLYDAAKKSAEHVVFADNSSINDMVIELAPMTDESFWLLTIDQRLRYRDRDGAMIAEGRIKGRGQDVVSISQMNANTPDGRFWLATTDGMYRWNGQDFERIPGSPEGRVSSFAYRDGEVWLGRVGTVERYGWNGEHMVFREQLDERRGMPLVEVKGLVLGTRGNVWIQTVERGLMLYQSETDELKKIGRAYGIPVIEFDRYPVRYNASSDMALLLFLGGALLIDANTQIEDAVAPSIAITDIQMRRKNGALGFNLYPDHVIEMHPGDRDLKVTARVLSYADPSQNRYRFKVDDYDADWVEVGSSGERIFSGIPPGKHRLMIQAAGPGTPWSEIRHLDLTVVPPWWRSRWGITFFSLLGVLLILGVMRYYRVKLQRQHQWQLVQQKRELAEQASLAKTHFLATLGHEVRTPMTGVLGMSELLLDTPLKMEQRQHVEAIHRAGEHLLRLVNDALDLARIESGKLELDPQDFSLTLLVDDVVGLMKPMAHRKGLVFKRDMRPEAPPWLHGDVYRIRQILLNLLNNAVKFTESGYIGLGVEPLQPQGVKFSVSDSGPGLNHEQKQRIFQRFEQADGARTASRYGGSGLGLAISQELAMAMAGRVDVQSTPELGTTFIVALPLPLANSPVDAGLETSAKAHTQSALTLLLVEDDPMVADVIVGLLQSMGHHVRHASHGLAALTEISGQRFDAVLFDLDLPGISGFDLLRQVITLGYDGPSIAVTARADVDLESQTQAAGFDILLRKPVTGALLAQALQAALRRRESTPPAP